MGERLVGSLGFQKRILNMHPMRFSYLISGMNLDQLRAFVALAERGQVTEAARRLGLSQPTLSRQVQALEDELAVKLFVRTPRGVALTDSGQRFVPRAREAIESLRQGAEELRELQQQPRGPVAIGALPTVGAYALPTVLGDFVQQYKEVRLRLLEDHADELEEKVAEGDLDMAVTTLPPKRQELVAQKLWNEPFKLVVPRGHKLAKAKRPASLSEVTGEPLVVIPNTIQEEALRRACEANGVEPNIAIAVEHAESQRRMVERGIGVALLPAIMLRDHTNPLCEVVDVRDGPRRTVALLHRGEASQTFGARALKKLILERLRQPS
jgi:LysR family transcriptional activator of glutamate synthase operon